MTDSDSLTLIGRLDRYPQDYFGLVIYDEAHHGYAPSSRKILGHFGFPVPREPEDGGGKYPDIGTCKLVGLTATPDRTDKKALVPDIFEEVAFEYPIIRAIQDGWLVPVKQVLCHLPGYDISKVRTVAGELNAADLAEVLEPLVTPMVQDIVRTSAGKRTLVYSVLKKLAVATTDALRKEGAGNVCTIVGETPRSSNAVAEPDHADPEKRWPDRERMFEAFRRGDLPYLSSVATLIEGVDLPEAEVAAVLRPTKSGLVLRGGCRCGRAGLAWWGGGEWLTTPTLAQPAVSRSFGPPPRRSFGVLEWRPRTRITTRPGSAWCADGG